MKFLFTIVILAALGYGAWFGYNKFQEGRSAQDIGETLMQSKKYAEALPYLERAHYEHPKDSSLVLTLAECYDRTGKKAQAAQCYRSVEPMLNDAAEAVHLRRAKERFAVLRGSGY